MIIHALLYEERTTNSFQIINQLITPVGRGWWVVDPWTTINVHEISLHTVLLHLWTVDLCGEW
jgi:hypothetical protein